MSEREQDKNERLLRKNKNAWDLLDQDEHKAVYALGKDYSAFLDAGKTERECTRQIVNFARSEGFVSLEEAIERKLKLVSGNKIYYENREKSLILAVIGEEPLEAGVNIIGAHLDSPRLDLKPNPLYESANMALFKTHYYGGIKKYHWPVIPLALHGVVLKADGTKTTVVIGETDTDPVFVITDLLPHLAKDQMNKKLSESIPGENLNLLVGTIPVKDEEAKERVKLAVMEYLNREYGWVEEDFISAELQVVPAGRARDAGFDRSLIAAYGHDDRACAYPTLRALAEIEKPRRTALALFTDKEEIGSTGNTGMQARFFENFLAELSVLKGDSTPDLGVRRLLARSRAISADVNAAEDPNFRDVVDKYNAARLGYGIVLTKYTGSGGKYHASDANAEFVSQIRRLFNSQRIAWQAGELGKVDQGGGGTIAQYLANLGMDVLDCGVALLSMHAPLEIVSKVDLYMAYKAYKAFFSN